MPDKELRSLYKKVCEEGVGIRFYAEKDNITNLKGQIKIDQSGGKKAILVPKKDKKYQMVSIETHIEQLQKNC